MSVASSASPTPTPGRRVPHPMAILGLLLLAGVSYAIAQTIVAPALPTMQREYATDATATSWVLTAFLLSASVATPLAGKLGDLFGRSRVLGLVLLVFGTGAIVSALAQSIEVLIVGRTIQGIGGGVFPLAISIMRESFPKERLSLGIGSMGATFGVGSGLGLPLSGVIVDNVDLSWIFWIGALTIPAGLAIWGLIPGNEPEGVRKVDWFGALVLALGLAAALLGVSQGNQWGWGSPETIALIAGGLVVLVLFVPLQRRTKAPMVDMRVMAQRPVLLNNLATLLLGFSLLGSFVVVPQLAELPEATGFGSGLSIIGTGLVMLPSAAVMLVLGPVAGLLYPKLGGRVLATFGLLASAAGLVFFALLHSEPWHLAVGNAIFGVGVAFSLSTLSNLLVDSVDPADVGVSTGINAIMRTVGGAVGSAVLTAIITSETIGNTPLPAERGFEIAFWLGAGLAVLGALVLQGLRPQDVGHDDDPVPGRDDGASAPGAARGEVPVAPRAEAPVGSPAEAPVPARAQSVAPAADAPAARPAATAEAGRTAVDVPQRGAGHGSVDPDEASRAAGVAVAQAFDDARARLERGIDADRQAAERDARDVVERAGARAAERRRRLEALEADRRALTLRLEERSDALRVEEDRLRETRTALWRIVAELQRLVDAEPAIPDAEPPSAAADPRTTARAAVGAPGA